MIGPHALDGLLLRLVNTKTQAQAYVLSQLDLATILGAELLVLVHDPVGELLAIERQHAFDTMFGHKVETAAAGHRLPDLHWAMYGAWHQGDLTQLVATVRDMWRDRVMLALM